MSVAETAMRPSRAHALRISAVRRWWPIALVLAIQLVWLWPVLGTSYVSDDDLNAVFWGNVHFTHSSYWADTAHISSTWWHSAGRFFPVSFYQGYGLLYLVHDRWTYKAIQVGLTLGATVSVAVLLRSLGLSVARTALALLAVTVAFQLRIGADPIMAFTGLMQSVVIETALSLACFSRWLRTRNRWALVGSLGLFGLTCLTYESAYVLSILHVGVAIAVRRPPLRRGAVATWRRTILAAWPPLAVSAICLVVASYGRAHAQTGGSNPYGVNPDPVDTLRTLGEQLFAGLPLSYVAKAPGDVPFLPHKALVTSMSLGAALVGLAIAATAYGLLRRATAEGEDGARERRFSPLAGVLGGALVWFFAAAPIALARRYQLELRWGTGHIPVFIEDFGVGLVLASLAVWLSRWRGVAVVVAALFGLTAAVTYGANVDVADSTHASRDFRALMEDSLRHGLVDGVPDGATILDGAITHGWAYGAFYYQQTERRFRVEVRDPPQWDSSAARHPQPCGPEPDQGAYWVRAVKGVGDDPDWESLTCLGRPGVGRDGHTTDRLYVRRLAHDRPFLVIGARVAPAGHTVTFAKLSTELGARSAGDHAEIMSLPMGTTPVSANTMALDFAPDPSKPFWGDDCVGPPAAASVTCGTRGSVTLVNPGGRPLAETLRLQLQPAATPGAWRIGSRRVRVGRKPVAVAVDVTVPSRATRRLEVHAPAGGGTIGTVALTPTP